MSEEVDQEIASVPSDTSDSVLATSDTSDKPDTAAVLSSMMEKLNMMESKIQATAAPKVKAKRQASQKQLENLEKARLKRNENMLKRKEIKKDLKIKEKKLVNDELERQTRTPGSRATEPEPEPAPRSRATEPAPKQVEEKRQTIPQAPMSVTPPESMNIQYRRPQATQQLGWTYSTRRYKRQ